MRRALTAATLLLALSAAPALACIWDYDTKIDEERGLPSLLDAIVGRYEVHPREYYEERRDRLLAKKDLTAEDYDDLAVAFERMKDSAKAASLMEEKEKRYPGQYTTQANWGTFLVHGGQLEAGLEHLKKALEINPDAHFGREKYQIRMIEYLIATKKDPKYADTHSLLGPPIVKRTNREEPVRGFYDSHPEIGEDVWSALVGILKLGGDPGGGWHELYVMLGELLESTEARYAFGKHEARNRDWRTTNDIVKEAYLDHQQLAALAYLRAIEQGSPRAEELRARLKRLPEKGLEGKPIEHVYGRLRGDATEWVASYQEHERKLLAAKKDPHDLSLWEAFYQDHGRPLTLLYPVPVGPTAPYFWYSRRGVFAGVGLAAFVVLLRVVLRRRGA